LADELDARMKALGSRHVAAFIFEPVVGAAGGVVPAPPGYAKAVRAVCDRHDVLVISDEVMCGAGRCGTWRALEHDGIVPDIMAVGKGLAGGYIPLAATILAKELGDTILSGQGSFLTGHTYSGHTTACAAGLAVQRIIERESLVSRVRIRGEALRRELREALQRFDEVGDVRGRGYLIGVELVRNRATKEPFPAERAVSHTIGRRAFEGTLEPGGLRPRHLIALKLLSEQGPASQQALADSLSLDPSNVVGLLNELEERQLITRRRDSADRRRHIVELSPRGQSELCDAYEGLRQIDDDLLGALSLKERAVLYDLLVRAVGANTPPCDIPEESATPRSEAANKR